MPIRSFSKSHFTKKGRRIFLLPFFIFLTNSCNSDPERFGRISFHNTADKNSFVFSINEDFLQNNRDSAPDKKILKMSKAEAKLLIALLKQKKYCLSDDGAPLFNITSRQERIYDMTFAHLIEESYNARPITPRMYFGQCAIK